MNTTVMAEQLLATAILFRVTAAELRGLAKGPIQTEHDTIVAVEAYLYKGQMKSEPHSRLISVRKRQIFLKSSPTSLRLSFVLRGNVHNH
jgi:hypothetical protein